MDFLFGKKHPIYDSKGRLAHRWEGFMDRWKTRYQNSANLDWRNHSGLNFSESQEPPTEPPAEPVEEPVEEPPAEPVEEPPAGFQRRAK